jgi:hypothetical protein
MTSNLPAPATVDQEYLAAILAKLQTTNDLLHALLVQSKPAEPPAGEVVLREPAKRKRSK